MHVWGFEGNHRLLTERKPNLMNMVEKPGKHFSIIYRLKNKAGLYTEEEEALLVEMTRLFNGTHYADEAYDALLKKFDQKLKQYAKYYKKSVDRNVDFDAYYSAALMAFYECILSYNVAKGRLVTHLDGYIKKHMHAAIYEYYGISEYFYKQIGKIKVFRAQFLERNIRNPTDDEICSYFGYTKERLAGIYSEEQKLNPYSINFPDNEQKDETNHPHLPYMESSLTAKSPEDEVLLDEKNRFLDYAISLLDTERKEIALKYLGIGKYSGKPSTIGAIAKTLKKSKIETETIVNEILLSISHTMQGYI